MKRELKTQTGLLSRKKKASMVESKSQWVKRANVGLLAQVQIPSNSCLNLLEHSSRLCDLGYVAFPLLISLSTSIKCDCPPYLVPRDVGY
jgi:hypothetical protein